MLNFDVRVHPGVIFAYSQNFIDIIIRAESNGTESRWCEANIFVPEKLSLSPDHILKKARMRLGIVEKDSKLEKNVKIYAGGYTNQQIYRCKVTLYTYDKNGVIDSRLEKNVDIRCELKKPDVL